MTTVLSTVERPSAIRQQIQAGSQFGGVAPSLGGTPLTPTFADDTFKFAAGDAGGLFDHSSGLYAYEKPEALLCVSIEIAFGTQTSWKLEKKDADGNLVELFSGTTEASFVRGIGSEELPLILLWGDQLLLTTVGATGAMSAYIKLAPHDLYT